MKENKRKLDLKPFIGIVLAFGLVLGFSDAILSVYEKIVVNPILSNYNSHWFSELSIIIVCLTFLIKGITKVHKAYNGLLNNYILFGGSFFVVIYWLVRFSTTKYNFYEFADIKGLY